MISNDTSDRIVVNISWSLDTKVFKDLSKELHDKTGEPGHLAGNTFYFPENFANGYCKHWRVEEHMAAFYIRYTASRPFLFRRSMQDAAGLTLIGFIGSNNVAIGKHASFIAPPPTVIETDVNTGETVIALIVTVTPSYLQSLAPGANRDWHFNYLPDSWT
ncbi:hypothetical protein MKQ70_04230 [Chitinophaga sedimenti]|uniref:hypothetical protein n=1 Tax=Chitinophaga sedimenti TaxID=2033606 RepID=UPI0020030D09|nr:hypothetical protein [Chitinophaga sedimenti]MCK7554258.1 hypothetical protein [Chitinophaga sedimenti]